MDTHPENAEIASKLGITLEVVKYIRPRLLNKVYNGDCKLLHDNTLKHIQGSKIAEANGLKAVEKLNAKIAKFPMAGSRYTKKIEAIKFADERRKTVTIPLYEAVVKFLATITDEQKKLIMVDVGGEKV